MRCASAILLVCAAGCSDLLAKAGPAFESQAEAEVQRARLQPMAEAVPAAALPPPPPDDSRADRKVIFQGALTLLVPETEAPERELRRIVGEAAGWVHKIEGTQFTLRVPVARFHAAMDQLSRLGRLLDRRVSGADVTEEFFDLQIRIDNAENVRKRLIALLEKCVGVKEAIEVERELARLAEEIERMKGRLKLLADQSSFSTIVVALQRTASSVMPAPRAAPFPFRWVRDLGAEPLLKIREVP